MVGHAALNRAIGVRIPASQPNLSRSCRTGLPPRGIASLGVQIYRTHHTRVVTVDALESRRREGGPLELIQSLSQFNISAPGIGEERQ